MPYRSVDNHARTPQNKGRFPGFDVLDQAHLWDDVTAGVVLARLARPGQWAFFTPSEIGIAGPLVDLLLNQDAEPRVPVLALIDQRLAVGETDGWHYDDMPEDAQAWRETLDNLDEDAQQRHRTGFAQLSAMDQSGLISRVQGLAAADEPWHSFRADHTWSLWVRYACTAFYSHPWAWNEIGFGGPAYPRGYLNLGIDSLEKWEVADHDGRDPIPFARRVERARQEQAGQSGVSGAP